MTPVSIPAPLETCIGGFWYLFLGSDAVYKGGRCLKGWEYHTVPSFICTLFMVCEETSLYPFYCVVESQLTCRTLQRGVSQLLFLKGVWASWWADHSHFFLCVSLSCWDRLIEEKRGPPVVCDIVIRIFLKIFSDFSSADNLGLAAVSGVGRGSLALPWSRSSRAQAKGMTDCREEESVLLRWGPPASIPLWGHQEVMWRFQGMSSFVLSQSVAFSRLDQAFRPLTSTGRLQRAWGMSGEACCLKWGNGLRSGSSELWALFLLLSVWTLGSPFLFLGLIFPCWLFCVFS